MIFGAKPGCVQAFTLVEVTLALGLFAFCAVGLIGMLPVGLNTVRAAREQAGAANCLEQIAGSLRGAYVNSSGKYQAVGAYSNLSWSIPNTLANVSLGGVPDTNPTNQQLAVHVEIKTMPTVSTPGTALLSVAWPREAQWVASTGQWSNAQGSTNAWLIFLPQP